MATVAAIALLIVGLASAVFFALRNAGRQDIALQQANDELELERARRAADDERIASERAARKEELDNAVEETARDRDVARAAMLMRAQLARLKGPKP